jgi:hypothetical protein
MSENGPVNDRALPTAAEQAPAHLSAPLSPRHETGGVGGEGKTLAQPVHRNCIVPARRPFLAIPGGKPLRQLEAGF